MQIRKLITATLLIALLISCLAPLALATEPATNDISKFEFPTPAVPNYMLFEPADRTATEGSDMLSIVRQTDMEVLALSAEYYANSDAFYEKYGLYSFAIVMQYDTSLNGTDSWNYTPDWDSDYSAPSACEACPVMWIGEDLMELETLFDLYYKDDDHYNALADAIIQNTEDDGFENYYFDTKNHSLYIRCRYYMEWETYDGENIGEKQSAFSEWSEPAIFGKNSTAMIPEAPTGYEAPVIADLAYVQPGEGWEQGHLTYMLTTPQSIWDANVYYIMTGDGYFDGLETEISVNGSKRQRLDAISDREFRGRLGTFRRPSYSIH